VEDRLEMAQILARRPEPESRRKAMQLLEEVDQMQPLNADASLILGNLYFATGDWNATQRQFLRSFARFPNSAPLRMRFASMLLGRGGPADLKLAEDYVGQLRKMAPNTRETLELTAMLAIKTGNEKIVLQALIGQLPPNPDPKAISDEQAAMLELHTNLYVQLKEYDRAEQILRLLAKRDPQRVFTLAQFLGSYRDVAQCFDLLDAEIKPEQIVDAVRVGVSVIRARRHEVGDKFDARMEAWLDRGLRNNGASVPLLIAKAEFLEIQRKYPEASAVYRELLSNPDVVGVGRAVVLNNLSFLMALANSGDGGNLDPLRLVQEAADILGPTADILDTRAVVYTARKQYDRAIQDLELSVTDNPTAGKYFHKSVAHLRNGQNKAAIDSWTEAEKRGLSRDSLHPLELETYEALKSQIEKLRAGGA
jgi:cellulose synthase operon protein C